MLSTKTKTILYSISAWKDSAVLMGFCGCGAVRFSVCIRAFLSVSHTSQAAVLHQRRRRVVFDSQLAGSRENIVLPAVFLSAQIVIITSFCVCVCSEWTACFVTRVINTHILRFSAEDATDAISASTGDNRMPGTDGPPTIQATRSLAHKEKEVNQPLKICKFAEVLYTNLLITLYSLVLQV